MSKEKNRLVVIGFMGVKTAYLNVSREEAIRRYEKDNDETAHESNITEFEFDDSFAVYDAWHA